MDAAQLWVERTDLVARLQELEALLLDLDSRHRASKVENEDLRACISHLEAENLALKGKVNRLKGKKRYLADELKEVKETTEYIEYEKQQTEDELNQTRTKYKNL